VVVAMMPPRVLSEQALAEATPTLMQDSLSKPSRKPGCYGLVPVGSQAA
jgi:hypothetical protein